MGHVHSLPISKSQGTSPKRDTKNVRVEAEEGSCGILSSDHDVTVALIVEFTELIETHVEFTAAMVHLNRGKPARSAAVPTGSTDWTKWVIINTGKGQEPGWEHTRGC